MVFKRAQILMILIFLFCFNITYSIIGIKKISSRSSAGEIIFEFATKEKAQYKANYDAKNQLLFLEIKNSKLQTTINKSSIINKNTEDFKTVDLGGSSAFFITQKNANSYKVISDSGKLTVKFLNSDSKKFTIVIDPGHGGKDPGASYYGKNEKDIVLNVSKYIRENLSRDFNIILTRGGDSFVKLPNRPEIANKKNADMFISVHANAATDKRANGIDVFYFSKTSSPYAARIVKYENGFDEKFGENTGSISQILGELEYKKYQEVSAKLAKGISSNLARKTGMKNNGIDGANFAVLRGLGRTNTAIPGVLVELGFLTNSNDREKLGSAKKQKAMADAISEEVRKYFN